VNVLNPYRTSSSPAIDRLSCLAPLSERDRAALAEAMHERSRVRPRGELLREGQAIGRPKLLLEGWAARVRMLDDGRRQFMSMLLPGDLVGSCRQARPLAVATVVALCEVQWCHAPEAEPGSGLGQAYAASAAFEEAALLAQITRLGRMTAAERICDFLLELRTRLAMAGLASDTSFDMPLTQETLADALGLTSVHVNRVVQGLRRDGDLQWKGGRVTLTDPDALAAKIGRVEIRVSEG
jgi:CRP-like cAMP-binding protein